jgi:hypothetical protein
MPDQNRPKTENSGAGGHPNAAETAPRAAKRPLWSVRRWRFWAFCALLGLALIGMGVTETTEGGGSLYWLILLWVYAFFSLGGDWVQARQRHVSFRSTIHLHFFHWLGALVAIHIVFLLERHEILARDGASDVSLVILALASYLAGLHFERLLVVIGVLLAMMAVIGAFVELYTLWLFIIPTSLIAGWLVYRDKLSQTHNRG